MKKNNTIFCDIDGSIFKYRKFEMYKQARPEILDGAKEKINEWYKKGHFIVLTTARPENLRQHTVSELDLYDIMYHRLIMGIGRGTRFLINDLDPNDADTERAVSVNLLRDSGLGSVYWDEWRDM